MSETALSGADGKGGADIGAIAADAHGGHTVGRPTVYVYEAPVRICHWVNAIAITVLMVTGYLIASPPVSAMGEASANFMLGYIRFAHFAAGQILAVFFLARIFWAFVGNYHARQIFYLPVHRRSFWREVLHEIRWYAFLERDPKMYVGHNPLAQVVMFCGFTLFVTFMIITGFALYSEGAGIDSWSHKLTGWVFAIWPNSHDVHTWHHLGMWGMVVFAVIHIYAAVREDIMSRQSIISSMISGERQFRN
jgi:Ni/Fe-hydrogenase 1 B-type cytochrome subunit